MTGFVLFWYAILMIFSENCVLPKLVFSCIFNTTGPRRGQDVKRIRYLPNFPSFKISNYYGVGYIAAVRVG